MSKPRSAKPPFITLLLLLFFNGIRVGAQLVMSAWLAVQFTGDGHAVGVLFVCGASSALIFARPIGKLVSGANSKKRMVLLGHGSMALVTLLPAVLHHVTAWHRFTILVVVCASTTALSQLAGGGTDYFVRRLSSTRSLQRKVATLTSVAQISMMIGTAGAGVMLRFADFASLFGGLTALSTICCALAIWRLADTDHPETQHAFRAAISPLRTDPAGLNNTRLLILPVGSMALAFAVGQITNVLLPGWIQLQRNGSSLDYSAVEIAWSAGSLIAGGILALYRPASPGARQIDLETDRNADRFAHFRIVATLAALATLLATIPFATTWPAIIGIHALLGIGYATVRVISEARFLTLCEEDRLGHTRATANVMMQVTALIAFSFPIVANGLSLPALYFLSAAGVGVATIAIGWTPFYRRWI